MHDFEDSAVVETSADRLFGYLADVRHVPDYFPKVLSAKARGGEDFAILFDLDGLPQEAQAWLRVDPARRRLQWGVPDAGYQGWLAVTPEADGCRLTVSVQMPSYQPADRYDDDPYSGDDADYEIRDTIESIRQIMRRTPE